MKRIPGEISERVEAHGRAGDTAVSTGGETRGAVRGLASRALPALLAGACLLFATPDRAAGQTNEPPTFGDEDGPFTFSEGYPAFRSAIADRAYDPDAEDHDCDWAFRVSGGADRAAFRVEPSFGGRFKVFFRNPPDFESPHDSDGDNVYEVTITATSATGARARSASHQYTVEVTDLDEADPPPQVTHVAAGPHRNIARLLHVRWRTVPGATGYKVQWKSGSEEYDPARRQHVEPQDDLFVGTLTPVSVGISLQAGVEYTVRIIATNAHGDAPASDEATGTPNASRPGPVTGVTVTPVGPESLRVTWNGLRRVDGYYVRWKWGIDWRDDGERTEVTGTSHTITGLEPATRYQVLVGALRTGAVVGWPSNVVSATTLDGPQGALDGPQGAADTAPPAQVTHVSAGPHRNVPGILHVQWRTVPGATGYKVQWKSGTEDYDPARRQHIEPQDDLLVGTPTPVSVGIWLQAGVEYTVRIIATNAHGDAPASDEATGVPKVLRPARVTGVTVTPVGPESLRVTWNGLRRVDGYYVRWKWGIDWRDDGERTEVTGTSHTITGLEPATRYQVLVGALRTGADVGWPSNVVSATTPAGVEGSPGPSEPPVFSEGTATTRSFAENTPAGTGIGAAVGVADAEHAEPLAWRLSGPDAASFDIDAATGQIRTKDGVDYDFETRESYAITVTVADAQGREDEIAVTVALADVDEPPARPDPPGFSTANLTFDSIPVVWDAPANTGPPITGYRVRYHPAGGGTPITESFEVAEEHARSSWGYVVTGLTPNTRYAFAIVAVNDEGDSAPSQAREATTRTAPPSPPTAVTATADGGTAIDLRWTAPAPHPTRAAVTGYRIERRSGTWPLPDPRPRALGARRGDNRHRRGDGDHRGRGTAGRTRRAHRAVPRRPAGARREQPLQLRAPVQRGAFGSELPHRARCAARRNRGDGQAGQARGQGQQRGVPHPHRACGTRRGGSGAQARATVRAAGLGVHRGRTGALGHRQRDDTGPGRALGGRRGGARRPRGDARLHGHPEPGAPRGDDGGLRDQ